MRGGQSFVNGLNTIENIKKYMAEKGMQIQEERKLDSETIQYIYSQS
jgi:hypothetical protein